MTLCVAEWLIHDDALGGKNLLEQFCRAYEPWRHYGSGARLILESFPNAAADRWADLATAMFPQGETKGRVITCRVAGERAIFQVPEH